MFEMVVVAKTGPRECYAVFEPLQRRTAAKPRKASGPIEATIEAMVREVKR